MSRGLKTLALSLMVLGLGACATTATTFATDQAEFQAAHLAEKRIAVPLIVQAKAQCGPATLTMALKHIEPGVLLEAITAMSFTPKAEGSFQNDILSATRRAGYTPYPIQSVGQLIAAVVNDLPVVVFQNLGFWWSPVWHYALIVGYQEDPPNFLLHTGDQAYQRVGLAQFLKTWDRGDRWAYVMTAPETIPPMASLEQALENAAVFSRRGQNPQSLKVYRSTADRFLSSFQAYAGLGLELAALGRTAEAIKAFERAIQLRPKHPGLYYNLAALYHRQNQRKKFEDMKLKSLEMASDEGRQELLRRYSSL